MLVAVLGVLEMVFCGVRNGVFGVCDCLCWLGDNWIFDWREDVGSLWCELFGVVFVDRNL